jgi:hypothetical protein
MRDVLIFKYVDAGDRWLIFGMSPAKLAAYPPGEEDEKERVHTGHAMIGAHLYLSDVLRPRGFRQIAPREKGWMHRAAKTSRLT